MVVSMLAQKCVGNEEDEYSVSCFDYVLDASFGCVKYEEPDFKEKRWTTLMGIGPAKSGTSTLSEELTRADMVGVGDLEYEKTEKHRLQPELQWLASDESVRKGIKDLGSFFLPTKGEAVAYFEKDPQYETKHAAYAAYRARAFLGPNLKLLHTSRDFVELDGSLYLFRKAHRKGISYADWVDFRIEGFHLRQACRDREFSRLMIPAFDGSKVSIRDLHNPKAFSRESAGRIETLLYQKCDKDGPFGKSRPSVGIQDYMHAIFMIEDLKRWVQAFGKKENFHCVDLSARVKNPVAEFVAMYKFIGVDDEDFFEAKRADWMGSSGNTAHHPPPDDDYDEHQVMFDRLLQAQIDFVHPEANFTQAILDARKRIRDLGLSQVTCEDLAWYEDICGHPAPGYEGACANDTRIS